MGISQSVVQDVAPYSLPVDVPHEAEIVHEEYTPLVRKMVQSPNFTQLIEIHKASADLYHTACPDMPYQVGGKKIEKVIEELTPLARSPSFLAHRTPSSGVFFPRDATPLKKIDEEGSLSQEVIKNKGQESPSAENSLPFTRILPSDEASSPRRLDVSPRRRPTNQDAASELSIPEAPAGPLKSPIRRHPLHTQGLSGRIPGCNWKTAWDIFQTGKERSPEGHCLGQRKFLNDNRRGEFEWITYSQVEKLALELAASFTVHNLCPTNYFEDEEYIGARHIKPLGIYAKNCVEWFTLEQACNAAGMTLVPLYDTLGTEAIVYIINQTRMNCIVVSMDCLAQLQPVLKETTSVEHVIILDISRWICSIFQNGFDHGMATLRQMCGYDGVIDRTDDMVPSSAESSDESSSSNPAKSKSGKTKQATSGGTTSLRDDYLGVLKSLSFFLDQYPLRDFQKELQKIDGASTSNPQQGASSAISTNPSAANSEAGSLDGSPGKAPGDVLRIPAAEGSLHTAGTDSQDGSTAEQSKERSGTFAAKRTSTKSVLFSSLLVLGSHSSMKPLPVSPHAVQTLCYTSGTTGNPKGVIITHGAFVTTLAGNIQMITMSSEVLVQSTDRHLSYLPLAHIYERIVSNLVIFAGAKIGLYSGNVLQVLDDLKELKPTLFVAVPRIYSRIVDQVMAKVAAAGTATQWVFQKGLQAKLARLRDVGKPKHLLWDNVVFNKVREQIFGSELRFLISGGAAIDQSVQELVQVLFSVTLMQGYGLTETLGAISMTRVNNTASGHVGGILPSCEFYLEGVEEMGATPFCDRPSGEIVVRSHGLSKGYFRNSELTREVFTKDGWFHTGDIGQLLPDGALKIVDRKKNIFKLSQGEYVAPEKIEGVYCQSTLISQIFVYGYSDKDHLVGIVVPDFQMVMQWAKDKDGLKEMAIADLVKVPELKPRIATEMEAVAKTAGLKGFEKVRAFEIVAEAFTVENGLLTPTMKLKRAIAAKQYRDVIDRLYAA